MVSFFRETPAFFHFFHASVLWSGGQSLEDEQMQGRV